MAYVNIYYHREPSRLGKHVHYIAERAGSTGVQGLGPEFRRLRGDVTAAVRLLEQHAAQARTRTGDGTRDGPFARLLFTLPTNLARRVDRSAMLLGDGPRLVLRDAIEATFRSAGRELQGVYAIHFHAEKREAHGHVHVDLSPLDQQGRTNIPDGRAASQAPGGMGARGEPGAGPRGATRHPAAGSARARRRGRPDMHDERCWATRGGTVSRGTVSRRRAGRPGAG